MLASVASAEIETEFSDKHKFFALESRDSAHKEIHWTLSLEAIALKRSSGSVNQPLINQVSGNQVWYSMTQPNSSNSAYATELFNSNQFNYGYQVGPKITINYRDDSGVGLELSYFNVLNLNGTNTTGPNGNWLTMYAPGPFWQTQDSPNQGMTWRSTTNLYSAEVNTKSEITRNLKLIAGFRWIQLNDTLTGAVTPPDQFAPAWKASPGVPCGGATFPTFQQLSLCGSSIWNVSQPLSFSNFWVTSTTNNLFGLQLGAEGDLFNIGKLSLGGSLKAGVYNNRATQSDWVSMAKQFYYGSATRSRPAYAGDAVLQLKYHLTNDFAVKLGYQLLWLDKIALAPGQIPKTYSNGLLGTETANGVNAGSNILFQGGALGIEYMF
jgi:hypothetical protein